MISVEDALARILAAVPTLKAEDVPLENALGRVLADDLTARRTQPPFDASAMDGYAVRAEDVSDIPAILTVIGEAPAGSRFDGVAGPGEAVRIFTGGPVPKGADTIIIQENVTADGNRITINESAGKGRHIRPAGQDFQKGDTVLNAGRLLSPREIGLAAAANAAILPVTRRPKIAILATGDELAKPGDLAGPNQIINSNTYALAALIRTRGGEAIDLGIARDNEPSIRAQIGQAKGADMLITIGGASVGVRDLVKGVLESEGMKLDFWKIAMQPGKPLIFGTMAEMPVIGLPGNPVSAYVCAALFLIPAIDRFLGRTPPGLIPFPARLGCPLPANGSRQLYLRGKIGHDFDGALTAYPYDRQDSSLMTVLAEADCLILRPPHFPESKAGDPVLILQW